jgi:hypothetical protein
MKMCVFFPSSLAARSALESLLTRARALGLAAHLTDRFYDIDVAAGLSQLANELQRLPKKAPRTAYGPEEPLKNPLLGCRSNTVPSTFGWPTIAGPRAGRGYLRVRRKLGFRPLVCNATLPNEHSRCSRRVGLERKISMTSHGKCATYFSV